MRRLLPDPAADVSLTELVEKLRPWDDPPESRPHVMMNFALTLDGRTTISGVSGDIGSDFDTQMLVALRTRVDAVMVGAGTLRAEKYGRVIADPGKLEERSALGLTPTPLLVIVSGSLNLPWDLPVFSEEDGSIVIVTQSSEEPPETRAPIEMLRFEDGVDLAAALAHLRDNKGVRALLCEGGPTLHAALHEASLVDEIFITHAPRLAGGHGPGLIEGMRPGIRELDIDWLVLEPKTRELFARYRVRQD
jgi:riboflavin-specific deaminase-like protein